MSAAEVIGWSFAIVAVGAFLIIAINHPQC